MGDGFFDISTYPGHLYVIATLLPLLSFLIILTFGAVRSWLRRSYDPEAPNASSELYDILGGDRQNTLCAWIATGAIFLSFCCCLIGFVIFLQHPPHHPHDAPISGHSHAHGAGEEEHEVHWSGHVTWISLSAKTMMGLKDTDHATELQVGYNIDHLSAIMFLMVTLIATLIHLFSIGYMSEELNDPVEDHEVHTNSGHLHRRSRFSRFFMFLSLFCFSMLNLILADNLFQIFVSWELVGICSYLLIGYYYERTSASNAANKAFITNRIGDAGFIIGMLIIWTYVGTFNFEEIFQRVRSPQHDALTTRKAPLQLGGQIVRAELAEQTPEFAADYKAKRRELLQIQKPDDSISFNTKAILFPKTRGEGFVGVGPGGDPDVDAYENPAPNQYGSMPYWMLVLAGLGVFLGCVGKSAQFPLHVWLPDAMEGPTPVSALIHAATMVAAGVYLVGRVYPLFTPEVLLTIAYTGAITLFVAATIAVVMTDIKKVLAYSTVSQLGYMMLALGIGGWVAGLFHLITHAFFKALLFLGSGSVIFGCHHVQEMTKMGGLFPKMKVTALTMLIGVFAISGIPLFSGWYSKDAIVAQGFGFGVVNPEHFMLTLLPLVTAGITTFYMFRMWFMTFTGKPKDEHVYEHAHESPKIMTVPLVVLAFFSIVVAWGWPIWVPTASGLEHHLHHSQPVSVVADFGHVPGHDHPTDVPFIEAKYSERYQAHEYHDFAGLMALLTVIIGFSFAAGIYYYRWFDPAEAKEQMAPMHGFLENKWRFDELYSALLVRPAMVISGWCKAFDTYVIDGVLHLSAKILVWCSWVGGLIDRYIVDGLVNWFSSVCWGIGKRLRNVQTGYLRSYILFLVLAAVCIWVLLSLLVGATPAAK